LQINIPLANERKKPRKKSIEDDIEAYIKAPDEAEYGNS
jgi:hypothetical protein